MLPQNFKTHHSCHIDRMGDVLLRGCPKKSQNNLKEISQSQSFFEMTNALSGITLQRHLGPIAISLLNFKQLLSLHRLI